MHRALKQFKMRSSCLSPVRLLSTSQETPNATINTPDKLHGSVHWKYERLLSVANWGFLGAGFVYPHPIVDLGIGVLLPLHIYSGFGCIITDYLPARKFPLVYKLSKGAISVLLVTTIYGLFKYNTNDVGITEGIKNVWRGEKVLK